jgi:hypothetical protein
MPCVALDARRSFYFDMEMATTVEDAIKILKERKTHVYIATPCYSCVMTAKYATSLMRLQALFLQSGMELSIDFMGNESLIPRGRNVYCGRFLRGKATHLLFIDSDIGFDPLTIVRMLLHDKDVVAGIYPKKNINWDLVKRKLDEKSDEPIESMGLDFNINLTGAQLTSDQIENGFARVLDVPTGMMLISRDALQRVCDQYRDELLCINDIPGSRDIVPEYVAVFDCMRCPASKRYLSEDFAFCRRAQAIDVEIWADLASPLSHTGFMTFDGDISTRFVSTYVG